MKKKLATIPKLKNTGGTWFIDFSVLDAQTGKMKVFKIYRGFKNLKTEAQKKKWGLELIEEYTLKLKSGWSPLFDEDTAIYSDQLEYANLSKHFNKAKKATKTTRFFLNKYFETIEKGLEIKTVQTYKSKLRTFCNWIDFKGFGEYDISLINNKIILNFFHFLITEKKLDRRTILGYRQILFNYFKYLNKINQVLINPVVDVQAPPKTKDMAARPISERDLKKMMNIFEEKDPQLYMACMFQFYLAIRPGKELRFLKIKDIDLDNKTVTVCSENAKTVRRTIDMSDNLVELCKDYGIENCNPNFYLLGRDREPGKMALGYNTLRYRFNKVRDKLGLPDTYKFYSMKHTGGGKLLDAGFTIEEIKNHFGHQSIETTDNYLKRHFGNRNQKIINKFPKPF